MVTSSLATTMQEDDQRSGGRGYIGMLDPQWICPT